MFMGEFHHNVDEKGRLIIPSKFRNDLGNKFIITRGIEKCNGQINDSAANIN